MNYKETIAYLYDTLPMFSRIGAAAYKKDLTNTIALCEILDNPHEKFKSIHIAGTNGKGSTSHMLAAVLQTAGYKTGLYTSPHLKDFRERIKVNGEMCEQSFIVDFVEKIKPHIETIQPSFFEITVAMAFEYFALQKVDVAVIEVGLGGRLDSTNVIAPEISVITNIGWDHMNLLGNTLEQIAYEKAGIIKENIPVVVGEFLPETKSVFEKVAAVKNAQLIFAQEKRYAIEWKYDHHKLLATVVDKHNDEHEEYALDLTGIYQTKNLVTVLEALQLLQTKGWNISDKQIKEALSKTKKLTGLHGRWELIHENPAVILDVGHNEDGIKQIVEQLELSTYNQLHIIIGMVKDKAVEKVLSLLPKFASYYFTKAQIPRALPENELAQRATAIGLQGKEFPEVNLALTEVLTHAHKDDLILVCGSVFLVGEVAP
ncbi:bifunctional folylpolyglutamate synthase/dihydrofolate synthase [Panacibacter ginsenosidivorans]|uniref:Dihydrofolate synthase/folylpolyglutamate synthase n=1 Tax=Panacibacter ginsenosidivorans TaxID=1813871 RepID=A0A5B8V4S1_9BACT|nr:folylpolyglutamate synthase/dihydrofolate synthase family protein [Panacibacter ginsenosidivorans]QEC66380.1 bifunctional folylpolyglutamate synthase/dihydrofolate synthase [Panacibacter ginsenosidivorans]